MSKVMFFFSLSHQLRYNNDRYIPQQDNDIFTGSGGRLIHRNPKAVHQK